MIKKITEFLWLSFAILLVVSISQQIKSDFQDIKTSQAFQQVMLERLVLMQTLEQQMLRDK